MTDHACGPEPVGVVALVGVGNIGSNAAPLLATMNLAKLLLIDPGIIEPKNCGNQAFRSEQIGQPKVEAMAAQIRPIAPRMIVEPIVADLEDVPWGIFTDVDVFLGGLDSLAARQSLNERAYRLRIPYVDGGVDADGAWIGRVSIYHAGSGCLECSWGTSHYRQISRETPCRPDGESRTTPTRAPLFLGATVSSLMVAETVRILSGHPPDHSLEITFDLAARRWLTSRLGRSPRCRFDHHPFENPVRLATPFRLARIADLLKAIRDHLADCAAARIEFRRATFSNPLDRHFPAVSPFASVDALSPLANRLLLDLGLVPNDAVRVINEETSFLIQWTDANSHQE